MSIATAAQPARVPLVRTVLAGAVGNVMEWYDFGLFGFFAPTIAALFFPREDNLASLAGVFGVFATGFLMRPLGGILFGVLGDRLGRKHALELSVLLMALATTAIGLLPTYATIGPLAPILLTLMRLLQGLSVGGEYVGSMSFLVEHAPPGRRAYIGSWTSFTVVLGSLLASATAAVMTGCFSESQLGAWAWRMPFLAGSAFGALGLWLRIGVDESPHFLELKRTGGLAQNPVATAIRHDWKAILTTIGLAFLSSIGFYIPFVWLATWLSRINQPPLPESQVLTANTVALLALLVLTPFSAIVSDRIGRRPLFLASALGYAVLTYPTFLILAGGTFPRALAGGLIFAGVNGFYSGCMGATMVELFPTRTRYTGIAIGYNLAQAILGGTAAWAATMLIEWTGDNLAPAWYLTAAAVVAGLASLAIPVRHQRPLDESAAAGSAELHPIADSSSVLHQ